MEQTRAINALAPFLALSTSATSPRAAADLVAQATSAQNTFVFAELLQTPNIQALRQDTQYASSYKLLEIFAWGTLEDYSAAASTLLQLSDPQSHKLRLLTLLTLASRCSSSSQLSYTNLQQALSLPTSLALEQLVTDAIYAGLLTGTLNPAQQTVIITSVAPLRDLAPGSVDSMVAELEAWSQRCNTVLKDLESEIAKVKLDAARRAQRERETAAQVERAERLAESGDGISKVEGAIGARSTRSGRPVGDGRLGEDESLGEAMDLDGGGGPLKSAGKKSRGFGGLMKSMR